MTVIPFKRPESRDAASKPLVVRKSFAQFAIAMGMIGLVFFLLPNLWAGIPTQLLAVIHLLVAVVYFQQGPRIVAAVWIALTVAVLVLTGAPSPVSYALARGAAAVDQTLVR